MKAIRQDRQGSLVGESTLYQTCWPEFSSHNPHKEENQLPQVVPVTST